MADDLATGGRDDEVPLYVDLSKPSIARLYDYLLGGKEHFEIDRRATDALFRAVPEVDHIANDNRNHLRRGVHWMVAEAGMTQILDLGSGLPTEGNVHEIAHSVNPDVRVVYVDKDPMVLAHARALLAEDDTATVVTADARDPEAILALPEVRELLDPSQPFGVVCAGIVHHFDDNEATATVERIKALLPSGSYFLISHFLDDDEPRAKELEHAFLHGGLGTGRFRTWEELRPFFAGLELVEPGLVYANDWHPDAKTPTDSPTHTLYAAGIGKKA